MIMITIVTKTTTAIMMIIMMMMMIKTNSNNYNDTVCSPVDMSGALTMLDTDIIMMCALHKCVTPHARTFIFIRTYVYILHTTTCFHILRQIYVSRILTPTHSAAYTLISHTYTYT